MCALLLLFVLVPLVDLVLLLQIGEWIGFGPTIALVILTGFLGAGLVRAQGLSVLSRVQQELATGKLPAEAGLEGLLLVAAGAVLLTPGVLTDLAGFACLVPPIRAALARGIRARFERAMREGRVVVSFGGFPTPGGPAGPSPGAGPGFPPGGGGRVLDVEATELGPSDEPGA